MTFLKTVLATAILALSLSNASTASAATMISGVVCEGGVAPAIASSTCGTSLGDFGDEPTDHVL